MDNEVCAFCHGRGDFRGLQKAHITHRKMGGRHGEMKDIINDPRNIVLLCAKHHDQLDGRIYMPKYERDNMREYLKEISGWHEWDKENAK